MVEFFVNLHDKRHFSSCWSWIPCVAQLWPQIPSRDNSGGLLDLNYEQPLEI
jgi:hypothetical protein